jgi:hypothetical protein
MLMISSVHRVTLSLLINQTVFFRATPISATTPEPNNQTVAGTGTAVVAKEEDQEKVVWSAV